VPPPCEQPYTRRVQDPVDIAVIGAGAAGLMAAISAGRASRRAGRRLSILAVDGAAKIGAKILVAGGGRCNVTHHAVDETAYAGSTRPAIRNVLGRFGVDRTVEFFRELGVEFKREATGKLFPVTDDARTVLSALLGAAEAAGVQIRSPWRVGALERDGDWFLVAPSPSRPPTSSESLPATVRARRVILAAGGKALPRSGSDGAGYAFAKGLGHTVTRTFPALVPLTLPREHFFCSLAGIAVAAALRVQAPGARDKHGTVARFTGPTLLTHFGLSGPAVLDISRYYLDATARHGPGVKLLMSVLPQWSTEEFDGQLTTAGREHGSLSVLSYLSSLLPERLARGLCEYSAIDPVTRLSNLTLQDRRTLAGAATDMALPVTGDRGFTHAEVTGGGIPLSELHLDTMGSRVCPGLFICGEILDVDGRIGGFNFQWAWASGFVAGSAAAHAALAEQRPATGRLESGAA
jgi:predicted Rossmann fold flavoprotein